MTLYAALVVSVVFAAGTYLLLQRDLLRVVVGIVLISNSATLFVISAGLMQGGPPILPIPENGSVGDPLVQGMALTALIIGFGVAALLLAMVYRLYATHGTVDAEEISLRELDEAEALERDEVPEKEEVPTTEQDPETEKIADTERGR